MQAIDQHIRQIHVVARQQQRACPCLEFARNCIVFLGHADQIRHAHFQRFDLLPQHFHLAFLQRDRATGKRAGQFDFRQQLGMLFKEVRMIGQVLRDGIGVHDSVIG